MKSEAYRKGREAGQDDLPLSSSNYYERLSPEWYDWRLGWLDAFDEKRRERLAKATIAEQLAHANRHN